MTRRNESKRRRSTTNRNRTSARALVEGDTSRSWIAGRPHEVDVRAFTMTIDCDELLTYHADPALATLPEAKRRIERLIRAGVAAEIRWGVGVRTLRLGVRKLDRFIYRLAVREGMRPDAAAAWTGRAVESCAAAATERFRREHAARVPAARARLLKRLGADRGRDFFILAELHGVDARAERTVRLIDPLLEGNPHVFVGFTASTETRPASADALQAAAREVHLLGNDAGRVGINFQPPRNGAFFPGTRFTRSGVLSAGIADADLLTNAIRQARSAGGDDAAAEEALVDMHAAVLRITAEMGQFIASQCELQWTGVSPVSAPVNCTIDGAPPQRRSSWAVLEELHGAPVESFNILQATSRLNACFWRAALRSGQKICGFVGSFNPPAEDGLLAQRVREGRITVRDLVLQETVCSSGVDMVVVRPETTVNQIAALYAEVAALSDQWQKPLTVRVIVPSRSAPHNAIGDVVLGGLLGGGPEMTLPNSSGSGIHMIQTVGRLQRNRQ